MKKVLILILALGAMTQLRAQQNAETEKVKAACTDYIEGFYEGDEAKLKRSLSPDLLKFGYWKGKDADSYSSAGQMTYEEALAYARNVKEKENFAKPDAPRGIEIFEVDDQIAAAKVTAWWGFDYILLAKKDGKWMIEQVLWQGPLKKKKGGS